MFQSETYSVIDALFYDKATLGQKNTNWQALRLNTPVTDETGTTITANANYAHYVVINSNNRFSIPFAVELNTLELSYTSTKPSINILDSDYDKKFYVNSNCHYKIEISSNRVILYENGSIVNTEIVNLENVRLSLFLYHTNDSMEYANFIVYPI